MQFWHVSITTSLVSALNQLVEVMERREASTRTAANRAMGVQIRERPSKRQRRSFETEFRCKRGQSSNCSRVSELDNLPLKFERELTSFLKFLKLLKMGSLFVMKG
ncbi:uncharacterized protein [Physcomitrium patens]|uniref:uncharacterized protein isoform X3 n=1 Tax=Physcomitrium patens TaxID=3218 RepID=UPI003CCDAF26